MTHHLSTAYFHHDRMFKVVPRKGKGFGNMMKNDDTLVEMVTYF
jgi:hypothetical protein